MRDIYGELNAKNPREMYLHRIGILLAAGYSPEHRYIGNGLWTVDFWFARERMTLDEAMTHYRERCYKTMWASYMPLAEKLEDGENPGFHKQWVREIYVHDYGREAIEKVVKDFIRARLGTHRRRPLPGSSLLHLFYTYNVGINKPRGRKQAMRYKKYRKKKGIPYWQHNEYLK